MEVAELEVGDAEGTVGMLAGILRPLQRLYSSWTEQCDRTELLMRSDICLSGDALLRFATAAVAVMFGRGLSGFVVSSIPVRAWQKFIR